MTDKKACFNIIAVTHLFFITAKVRGAWLTDAASVRLTAKLDLAPAKNLLKVVSESPWRILLSRQALLGGGLVLLLALALYVPLFLKKLKLARGVRLLAKKDYVEARKVFEQLIKAHPGFYPPYLKLASIHRINKNYQQAIEVYKTALKIHKGSIELAKCIEIVQTEAQKADETKSEKKPAADRKKSGREEAVDSSSPTIESEVSSRYIIQEEIGEGGMGIIYKATDTLLDRTVALKVLSKSLSRNARALQRFLREAQSAGKLNHPNIVNIYDIGKEKNKLFIAMEHIEGENLFDILQKKGVINPRRAIEFTLQVCDGLGEAHKNGIIHRDIKLENIMVDKYNKIKIMDFGVAHIENKGMTKTGAKIGTPLYMSPEQICGEVVDMRSDIYSLGIVLYELLTGTPPFTEGDIAYMHLHKVAELPTKKNPAIPEILDDICLKAIAKKREDRYQTVGEFKDALTNIYQAATQVDEAVHD